jgi:hypothetical protein
MARQDALSIKLEDGVTAADLAEGYGPVIESVYANAVSNILKAQGIGTPVNGSQEFKRFENADSAAYGTARTAGAGADVQSKPVTINIDDDREIIEEVERKDVSLFGIPSLLKNRQRALAEAWKRYLDTKFFSVAYSVGTRVTTGTSEIDKLDACVVALQELDNEFIDGVPLDMIAHTVTPTKHMAIRAELDDLPAQDNFYAKGAVGMLHGVPVYISTHLPKVSGQAVSSITMMIGSIAQPVSVDAYGAERIPLSNALALELFWSCGTGALTPETITYVGDAYSAGS